MADTAKVDDTKAKGNDELSLSRIDTAEELSPAERELLRLEKEINADLDAKLAAKGSSLLWPKACWFIVPNEFGERFAYYGVKPLFAKYLTGQVGLSQTKATVWTSNFNTMAYLSPLFGAALSDGFLGKYHTIVGLSTIYAAGMILLTVLSYPGLVPYSSDLLPSGAAPTVPFMQFWTWCLPIVLVALGTGGIKPCVSSHGGDQYLPHQYKGLDFFFSIFYVSINVGSLVSGYTMPYIKETECFGRPCYFYPYLICAVVFVIAASVFAAGYKTYRIVPPRGELLPWKGVKTVAIAASRYAKADAPTRAATGGWLNFATPVVGQEFVDECRLIGKVLMMVLPCAFFWMVYDQGQNEWQFQLSMMKKPKPFTVENFGNMNTIFIITLVPSLAYFYRALERRNIRFTNLQRMGTGFFLMFLAYLLSGIMQVYVIRNYDPVNDPDCNNCVHGWWQAIQWFLLSWGEAMLSPEGLKFVYMNSGKQFRSQSTSLWLLMSAIGSIITAAVSESLASNSTFNDIDSLQALNNPDKGISLPAKYWLFAALAVAANVYFVFWAKFVFTYKDATAALTSVPRAGEAAKRDAALAKARQAVAEEGERTVQYSDVKGGDL